MPILGKKEIEKYKHRRLLEFIISNHTRNNRHSELVRRLEEFEQQIFNEGFQYGLPYYLAEQHHLYNASINGLAKRIGSSYKTINRFFEYYGIVKLTQSEGVKRKWKDPEFKKRNIEATLKRWNEDEELRENRITAFRQMIEDPDFKKRRAEMLREKWRDSEFRKKNAKGVREANKRRSKRWREKEMNNRILEIYDMIAPWRESYLEIIEEIASKLDSEPIRVRKYLTSYFGSKSISI